MEKHVISYKVLSVAFAMLCIALFSCLLLAPYLIYRLFDISGSETADLLSRRAAMLFLSLATISYLGRNAPLSNLRQVVTIGIATAMFGLLSDGIYEFFRGTAGLRIWVAIVGEAVFAGLYLSIWFNGRHR